jgi:hypothetical protein
MQESLTPYVDALTGKSPKEVQAALIGSLSSSPMGQEALAAIQRGQTFGVQSRQQDLAEKKYAAELAAAGHPVVTGWCRLDSTHPLVNITDGPLHGDVPTAGAYRFRRFRDVVEYPEPVVPTGFAGFALTCMSRDLWRQFPFGAYGGPSSSWSSDFHLSARLRDAGIPIVAAREGYVEHLKERWGELDRAPQARLLIGEQPPAVTVDDA